MTELKTLKDLIKIKTVVDVNNVITYVREDELRETIIELIKKFNAIPKGNHNLAIPIIKSSKKFDYFYVILTKELIEFLKFW